MFYELIYTRCKHGFDILRGGQAVTGEGYKVYACTPQLIDEKNLDLNFLANAVQTKQSYSDPDFMDDAYLYFAPDFRSGFMIDFHPVIYDKNAEGNYSHRPGNFLNHVLIGDYSEKYPFELFKNKKIWNAREKNEAYYYETDPSDLCEHGEINNYKSYYTFEDIKAFVADGRVEALAKTVSFLITQFEKKPENRKYLVIKDESSENIEKWIAAVECAFSPRIAAAIPFATRMDNFITANRYTINQTGKFVLNINLQDPKQKKRFRAMIIGVDTRDKSNNKTENPPAGSPFVLLNGIDKKALFEADISNNFFRLITSFTDEHKYFCRVFLQKQNINSPDKKIFNLYKIFLQA